MYQFISFQSRGNVCMRSGPDISPHAAVFSIYKYNVWADVFWLLLPINRKLFFCDIVNMNSCWEWCRNWLTVYLTPLFPGRTCVPHREGNFRNTCIWYILKKWVAHMQSSHFSKHLAYPCPRFLHPLSLMISNNPDHAVNHFDTLLIMGHGCSEIK